MSAVRLFLAAALLVCGALAAAALASREWALPRQSLAFPWIDGLPPALLAAFVALGAVLCGLAVRGGVRPGAGLVMLLSTCVGVWSGLYTSTLDDPIIPVFLPVVLAVTAGAAAFAALPASTSRASTLSVVLLVSAPVVALETFGYCLRSGPGSGLAVVAVMGGPGLLAALLALLPPLAGRRDADVPGAEVPGQR